MKAHRAPQGLARQRARQRNKRAQAPAQSWQAWCHPPDNLRRGYDSQAFATPNGPDRGGRPANCGRILTVATELCRTLWESAADIVPIAARGYECGMKVDGKPTRT